MEEFKCDSVDDESVVHFISEDEDKVVAVYVYLNLHGLFVKELKK